MTRPADAEEDWIPAPEVTSREVASGMILVNLDSGNCWQINATGSAFWQALTRLGSVPAAIEEVAATFGENGDQVAEDVRRFVHELANAGALIKRPPVGTTR
jgi:hypothetical protein